MKYAVGVESAMHRSPSVDIEAIIHRGTDGLLRQPSTEPSVAPVLLISLIRLLLFKAMICPIEMILLSMFSTNPEFMMTSQIILAT